MLGWFGWGWSWISESVLAASDRGSHLQVLWLLKDDAISGHYGYHRWVPCSGTRCVAMQTLPAAPVEFSLEDVWNPSRLNGEGGAKRALGGGGEVGGMTGGDLLLQMIYLSVWCKKNLDLLQLGDTCSEFAFLRLASISVLSENSPVSDFK